VARQGGSPMKKSGKQKIPREIRGININIPKKFHQSLIEIAELTDSFCSTYLNEEYKEFCVAMVIELCLAKVQINKGKPASWACGIVHALGWVNFLQDPSQSPHMTSTQIAEGFGVSQGTMLAKSKTIRDALDIMQFDPYWCLPALLDQNPLVWMLKVNGFMIDIREASRELQEQAYRQGLIPYIPADRQEPNLPSGPKPKIIEFPRKRDKTTGSTSHQNQKDDEPILFES
jgi:hypothetical protein